MDKKDRLQSLQVKNAADLFFSLLRNALWLTEERLPEELTDEDTKSLFWTAEQQTVSALIADALIRNEVRLPRHNVYKAIGIITQTHQTNQQINDELKAFARLGLNDVAVVKGQTVATFYPNPLLRMPGDIDFLTKDYDTSKDVLRKEWQIELPAQLIDKEFAFTHGVATYEIHSSLVEFGSRKHRRFWNKLMQRPYGSVEVDGVKIPTLEPTVYAVYVFVHLFFHFIREGVGLRQMCDWAMLLHHYREDIDGENLISILNLLGLKKAYSAFGVVLTEELGHKDFPFVIAEEHNKWKTSILNDIMHDGNFGKNARNNTLHGWRYKAETFKLTIRKCWKYHDLAPAELALMVPRLVWLNLKLYLKQII